MMLIYVAGAMAFTLWHISTPVLGSSYFLSDNVVGFDFFQYFDFEAIADPSHGRVNYTDQVTARALNLSYASHDTFILRADFQTVLDPNGPGRNSVRIQSKKNYTTHLAVFDIRHMPQGCGTWPAVREKAVASSPNGGLLDIIEGINDQPPDDVTLHTTSGCTMPASRNQTGIITQLDCDMAVNSNSGCGVQMPTADSYGPAFNSIGGGWFAMERTLEFIKIWYWERNDKAIPIEVKRGFPLVHPDQWGIPTAFFPNTFCDLATHLSAHNIIINLTLCGDWAGGPAYNQSGCPSSCVDFVNNNPSAFVDAYFDFVSLKIYHTSRE